METTIGWPVLERGLFLSPPLSVFLFLYASSHKLVHGGPEKTGLTYFPWNIFVMNRISAWSDNLWEEWTNISKYHFNQNIMFGVKMIMKISWVGVISKCLFKSETFRYTPIQTDVLNCFDNHNHIILTVWFIFTHLNISGQTAQFIIFFNRSL